MSKATAVIPVLAWISLNVATCILLAIPLRWRWYFLPAILIPATISFRMIQHLNNIPGLSELWGTITLIGLIHFTSLLYIKQWTFRIARNTKKDSTKTGKWFSRRLWTQMHNVALSPRFIGIRYENVVLKQQNSSQVKSTAIHQRFSMTRILRLLIKMGMHLIFNRLILAQYLRLVSIGDFVPARKTLPRRVIHSVADGLALPISAREIIVRVWFSQNSIWTPILLLDSIHATLAIFFIYVLRIDTSEDWPDLFGSPLEAYTLGGFGPGSGTEFIYLDITITPDF